LLGLKLRVDLAHKDFLPDFNVQYMWFRTDPYEYRARYQISVGIRIPIYRTRRQEHELAQAELEERRAHTELESESQQVASDLRQQYATAEQSAKLLKIYREGFSGLASFLCGCAHARRAVLADACRTRNCIGKH
jgi:outer membrane protein TolC